jgi:hypothetical protein
MHLQLATLEEQLEAGARPLVFIDEIGASDELGMACAACFCASACGPASPVRQASRECQSARNAPVAAVLSLGLAGWANEEFRQVDSGNRR